MKIINFISIGLNRCLSKNKSSVFLLPQPGPIKENMAEQNIIYIYVYVLTFHNKNNNLKTMTQKIFKIDFIFGKFRAEWIFSIAKNICNFLIVTFLLSLVFITCCIYILFKQTVGWNYVINFCLICLKVG